MGLDVAGILTLMLTVIGVGVTIGGLTFAAIRKLTAEMKEFRAALGDLQEGLRGEIHTVRDELRGEIHAVRDELRIEIHAVRDKLDQDVAALRGEIRSVRDELRGEIQTVREELRGEIAGVRTELRAVEGRQTDRVARLEDKVFRVPLPDSAADPAVGPA
ncbi:hypothetical protein [Candidatus Palauibacter sp.]|uniref:hypothetical protein n=1 Tax=Candidatus Palauibacter sp. TaxID=3101350 RepID=UPI003B01EED1